ncbi:MAG: ABC transporter permease [Dehalococcoidales bacterium]|nr:ABC transporter permease [Dehalococcoidales bacterium]
MNNPKKENEFPDVVEMVDDADWAEVTPKYSEARRMLSVFFRRPLPVIGLVCIVLMLLAAILAPVISPYDPYELDILHKLQHPNSLHLLGTDSLGRDTLSRIIYGSQTSLIIGLTVVFISTAIGVTLGLTAAYFGGLTYNIIMRLVDALMAFPMILLALLVASLLGGGMKNVIIALSIGYIAPPTRMMCGIALSVKQNEYVLAARTMGLSNFRIMVQQILPNAFAPLLVTLTIGLGAVILAEAGLSFLGVGITQPTAAWGSMVNDGYKYLLSNPVLAFAPGIAIMIAVFGFNMVGDGLRDALDPRLRGVV